MNIYSVQDELWNFHEEGVYFVKNEDKEHICQEYLVFIEENWWFGTAQIGVDGSR
ncbi:hypothetical protein JD969_01515 [Planctomycetota bacterium]|nr:hypothetical protein JD969_01515 [Planctomycetota bacterium]